MYLADITSINWEDFYDVNDLHNTTANCIGKIKEVINRHAPLKKASLSKKNKWRNHGYHRDY